MRFDRRAIADGIKARAKRVAEASGPDRPAPASRTPRRSQDSEQTAGRESVERVFRGWLTDRGWRIVEGKRRTGYIAVRGE